MVWNRNVPYKNDFTQPNISNEIILFLTVIFDKLQISNLITQSIKLQFFDIVLNLFIFIALLGLSVKNIINYHHSHTSISSYSCEGLKIRLKKILLPLAFSNRHILVNYGQPLKYILFVLLIVVTTTNAFFDRLCVDFWKLQIIHVQFTQLRERFKIIS